MTSELDDRLDKIYHMRQSGVTLEQIGRHFAISKQRVGALLVSHYGSTEVYGLLTITELARLTGYTPKYIAKLKERGVIQPVKGGRKNRLYKLETIATIITYAYLNPETCRMCGRPLPPGRWVFCSQACAIEGGRHKNRSQQAKEHQKARAQRWEEAHPEQAREIRRRAEQRYRAKRRALTQGLTKG